MKVFKKGKVVTNMNQLYQILTVDKDYIYYRGVPKHYQVIMHMPFGVVAGALGAGVLEEAIRK